MPHQLPIFDPRGMKPGGLVQAGGQKKTATPFVPVQILHAGKVTPTSHCRLPQPSFLAQAESLSHKIPQQIYSYRRLPQPSILTQAEFVL